MNLNHLDFGAELYKNWDKKLTLQSEYYQLNKRYGIDQYKKELPICITATGRNLLRNDMLGKFLRSVEHQNYTNYRLFITDDASTDGTYEKLRESIKDYPRLRTRTTLIRNEKNIGALGNKVLNVFTMCEKGGIVFDLDADDAMIGRQVMKLFNALYQQSDKWFIYSNHASHSKDSKVVRGLCRSIDQQLLAHNSYRTAPNSRWRTSQLRTFLTDLYTKVPMDYFLEKEGKFYFESYDRFELYPIVELSGSSHIQFIPDILYWYETGGEKSECYAAQIFYHEYMARTTTPLLPLKSLEDEPRVTPDYEPPKVIA